MVRIRLKRLGRRHRPSYRLAAIDRRRARDSKTLEELGSYDPLNPNEDKQIALKRDELDRLVGEQRYFKREYASLKATAQRAGVAAAAYRRGIE